MNPFRFIFLMALFFLGNASAQAPLQKVWDKIYGGSGIESVMSLSMASDSAVLLFGTSASNAGYEKSEPAIGLQDYWLLKLDTAGNIVWDKTIGGNFEDDAASVTDGGFGTYLIGGSSKSGVGGDKTFPNYGDHDFWALRIFEQNGVPFLNIVFGGSAADDLRKVIKTRDNGVLLCGTSRSDSSGNKTSVLNGSSDIWIVKTDFYFTQQWQKRFGGNADDALTDAIQTADGGFLLCGYSNSDASFEKSENGKGLFDYWIIKIDSAGNKQWDRTFGGLDNDFAYAVCEQPDETIFLAGVSVSPVSGNKSVPNHGSFGLSDYWLIKLASNGSKIWDKTFGGINAEDDLNILVPFPDGSVVLSGTSYSGISGNKTENNLGIENIWLVKTDSGGTVLWDKTIANPGHNETGLIAIGSDSSVYASTYQTLTSTGGMQTMPVHVVGTSDYWLVKLKDNSPKATPTAQLAVSDTVFCEKDCINFSDWSSNQPSSWQWYFPGAVPDTSTLQNPSGICYNSIGQFPVTLISCNSFGCDTLTFFDFISVLPAPQTNIWQSNDTIFSLPFLNYNWYELNSGFIGNTSEPFLVVQQPGSYYCVAVDSFGCEAVSNVLSVTGTDHLISGPHGFFLWPNPADQFITVGSHLVGYASLDVFNSIGEKVSSVSQVSFPYLLKTNYEKGVYILRINAESSVAKILFVIKR